MPPHPLINGLCSLRGAPRSRYCPPMPKKTPAEGGTDGLLAPPRQGGQNFRKHVAIFSGTRRTYFRLSSTRLGGAASTTSELLSTPGKTKKMGL